VNKLLSSPAASNSPVVVLVHIIVAVGYVGQQTVNYSRIMGDFLLPALRSACLWSTLSASLKFDDVYALQHSTTR
jgi:hypothetical protein